MDFAMKQPDENVLASVKGVFTDIDGTLTTQGKITSEVFDALWRLHDSGLLVVPVTGRCAGWCDHIARFWPVDAVVGENGGFYFCLNDGVLKKRFWESDPNRRQSLHQELLLLAERILKKVPGSQLASDQAYRECDLAVDFNEDTEPLGLAGAREIRSIFEQADARASISSIHVNGWFGEFDKLKTSCLWAQEKLGLDLEEVRTHFIYCGDSQNDEPMFRFFPLGFGMKNIEQFLSMMTHKPAFVTSHESGAGFCEVADLLLKARKNRERVSR